MLQLSRHFLREVVSEKTTYDRLERTRHVIGTCVMCERPACGKKEDAVCCVQEGAREIKRRNSSRTAGPVSATFKKEVRQT